MAKLYLALTNLRLQTTEKAANPFTLQDVSFALRERIEPKRVAALVRERGLLLISQPKPRANLERPARMTCYWMR